MKPDNVIRLMAGSFVLISVALAYFVSLWGLLLGLFIGVMLVVSATTGFCPPTLLFARLGWIDKNGNVKPFAPKEPAVEVPRINPATAVARADKGEAVLVDVREPDEWSEGVAERAHLLPLSDFQGGQFFWKPFLAEHGRTQICIYCGSGARANRIAQTLIARGYNVACAGGFSDYCSAELQTRHAA